jgi:hypothetical protein
VRINRLVIGLLLLLGITVVAASCAKASDLVTCPDGQDSCGSSCITLATDSANCGSCGNTCLAGQVCVMGKCAVECPMGDLKCDKKDAGGAGATCVNSKTDNDNCGSCGNICPAGQICYGGACSGTCGDAKSGQTVCAGDGGSPYCANLKVDQKNCGKCGAACSSDKVCVSGACQGSCTSDQTLCGADGGQYCADLMNDNANCGSCGAPCTGTLQTCTAGVCTGACTYGQQQCSDGGTSYCVDSLSDNLNCGTCGNVCASAKPLCSGGVCTTVTGGGTVRDTSGSISNVTYVKCGNGTNTNCTEPVAESSCTGIGLKLVSHASDGTSGVVSLGATISCNWSISYFTNNDSSVAGQCLVGVSNAKWSSCCTLGLWHGNTVTVPSTLGTQFGYVASGNSGYNGGLTNTSGTTWGCQSNATNAPARGGCSTYYVACK